MKREDTDVMEAKAWAALEDMPEDVRAARWKVDASCRDVSASNPDSEDIQRWDIVKPVHAGVKSSTLEHIATSDPHAVLALIAELRRVEHERDEYWAQGERLAVALAPVRDILRDLQRPAWDENEVARWGVRLSMTLPQARELAAACDAVDPEPPLRSAD